MKKIAFIILIALIIVPSAFSQFRLDMGVKVPVSLGIKFSELSGNTDTSYSVIDDFTFLFPEVSGTYQFAAGPIKLGAGVQIYTLILESIAWPMAFAEFDFSPLIPLVVNAKLGGLAYMVFGLYNHADTGDLVIPEVNAYFKLSKSFRLGGGVMIFTSKNFATDALPYALYLAGSFSTTF